MGQEDEREGFIGAWTWQEGEVTAKATNILLCGGKRWQGRGIYR